MKRISSNRRLGPPFAACLLLMLASCHTLQHTVGGGPTGSETVSRRQYYIFFGAFRVGENIDSARIAGDATSYRVTTQWSFADILINLFTAPLTVTSRTVTVEK